MSDYPEVDAKAVGRRIREAREAAGLSQPELGGRLGKQGHQIWRYEDGRNVPGSDVLVPLAAALGRSVSWLLYGRDMETQPQVVDSDDDARTALTELLEQWDVETWGPPPTREEQAWVNEKLNFRADRAAGLAVTPRLIRGRILERRAQQRGRAVEGPRIDIQQRETVVRPVDPPKKRGRRSEP